MFVCAQYMYAQDGGLREQILIMQEHPRLSITKTMLLMEIFSGYILENIKVKQLFVKVVMNLSCSQLLTHLVFTTPGTASKICPKDSSKGTGCFLLCALLCQGWSEHVFCLCSTTAGEAQVVLLRVGEFWLGLSCLNAAAALASPSQG